MHLNLNSQQPQIRQTYLQMPIAPALGGMAGRSQGLHGQPARMKEGAFGSRRGQVSRK